jgi:hypothetical protein
MSPNLSKAQILNALQCPRRFWLEQYHPENEGDVEGMDAVLDAEEAADAAARNALSSEDVRQVNGRLGLRSAIEQTTALLEPGALLLDATFDFEGISVQIDVLDWSGDSRRAISMTAANDVSEYHIEDCTVQAWAIRGLGLPEHRYLVGLADGTSDASFAGGFALEDVTERVLSELARIDAVVSSARTLHASLDEPPASTGAHCHQRGYPCPFLEYCEQS